ncbi:hypothetical protein AOLI_G00047650 [Acnodon oligacanthus]
MTLDRPKTSERCDPYGTAADPARRRLLHICRMLNHKSLEASTDLANLPSSSKESNECSVDTLRQEWDYCSPLDNAFLLYCKRFKTKDKKNNKQTVDQCCYDCFYSTVRKS